MQNNKLKRTFRVCITFISLFLFVSIILFQFIYVLSDSNDEKFEQINTCISNNKEFILRSFLNANLKDDEDNVEILRNGSVRIYLQKYVKDEKTYYKLKAKNITFMSYCLATYNVFPDSISENENEREISENRPIYIFLIFLEMTIFFLIEVYIIFKFMHA